MQASVSVELSSRSKLASDEEITEGISKAMGWLEEKQSPDGFWVGRLFSNSCMEAQWIMLQHVLGLGRSDKKFDAVVRAILRERQSDGTWLIYPGAEGGDINTTVECYAALRIAGHDPKSPEMTQTREWIRANGGLLATRNFTKYWLALIGEWDWDHLPTLPPELIWAPTWFPFNIYRFASWARGTIVPLLVISARRLRRELPKEQRLDELFFDAPRGSDFYAQKNKHPGLSWSSFFSLADTCLRIYQNYSPFKPGREAAIRHCLEWIIKHQEADGAWSGIQPPWVYSLMALHNEGYSLNHPVIKAGLAAFDLHWAWPEGDAIYLQASESPVWDTVLTLQATLDTGADLNEQPMLPKALDWVLGQQIRHWGDWQVFVKGLPPGGWAFEFENDIYPDTDDTAVALCALQRLRRQLPAGDARIEPLDRSIFDALTWLIGMQSSNGGWGAFDKDNDTAIITKIPFCDFGEVLDPPSVDVTAHVLEALALAGRKRGDAVVERGRAFILSEQEEDGSWFGRWGCNHVYGVGAVLPALEAIGEDMSQGFIRKAADWVRSKQNEDGGWGETCASYMNPELRGVGPSTASQTAWGLMGLLTLRDPAYDESIRRGLAWLAREQREDGSWDEPFYTATGFPGYGLGRRIRLVKGIGRLLGQDEKLQRAFMIKYDMYRHYFPLMALGRARQWFSDSSSNPSFFEGARSKPNE